MRGGRGLAIASALLALLAVAGCGLGPGEGLDSVRLTVTHDYGREVVLEEEIDDVTEADTVMRVLEGAAEIGTKEGGRFVKAIEGVESDARDGRYFDWLFYVNGIESSVGAADFSLHGGEAIWWDYRDWTSALHVPAVVGSWPQPFRGGYEGKRHPVAVVCMGGGPACGAAREALEREGVEVAAGAPAGAIRLLVGPWGELRDDPAARQIEGGVEESGVFASFGPAAARPRLEGLDEAGAVARRFGPDAGLVAATRRYEAPPTWVVTGVTPAGVRAAASLLDAAKLRDHYAVAIEAGEETPLPLPDR
jgi:hypothetical protein